MTGVPDGTPSLLRSTVKNASSVSSCSKAPRGLFVHVCVGRIFTAISISPGNGSRQLLSRSAFRAGRNFKNFRRKFLTLSEVEGFTLNLLKGQLLAPAHDLTLVFTRRRFPTPLCRHRVQTISSRILCPSGTIRVARIVVEDISKNKTYYSILGL